MASARITGVVIDEKALEEAAKRGKGVTAAVNERARQIRDAANSMSRGFRTGRYYDRSQKKLLGEKAPIYLYKPATYRSNPHAIVYTGNYAAMRFELENNGLLKASR